VTESLTIDGLTVERWTVGRHRVNAYLAYGADRRTLVVDPGAEAARLLARCTELDLTVGAIVLTHAHWDHVGGVEEVSAATGAPVWLHDADMPLLKQAPLWALRVDGVAIRPITRVSTLGGRPAVSVAPGLDAVVTHTPGHTPGGITVRLGRALFTGDTLFREHAGRTDLPGASRPVLVASLLGMLSTIDPEDCLLAGHGQPWSGAEARAWLTTHAENPPAGETHTS